MLLLHERLPLNSVKNIKHLINIKLKSISSYIRVHIDMNKLIVRIRSLNNQLGLVESIQNSSRTCSKETYKQQNTQMVQLLDSNFKVSNSYVEVQKADLIGLDGKIFYSY